MRHPRFHLFNSAIKVCFHVASPYTLDVEDAQRDLVDPAVKGTLNVLKSCHKNKIRRVVLTSSVAAITDAPKAGYTFTEKDFNELSTLARNPYFFSKICAELAAWDFVKDKPEMKLVSINPSGVIGPSLNKDLNATPKFLLEFLSGKFPFLFEAYIPMVHIDDVVEAHIKGGSLPESKFQGTGPHRFLCTQVPAPSYERILQILKEKYPKGTFPSSYQVPSWIPYALSYFYGAGTGSFLRTNISKGEMLLSNDVIKKEFRMEFQSVEKAICDTVDDFIKWGHLPA